MNVEVQPPRKPRRAKVIILWLCVAIVAVLLSAIPFVGWILSLAVIAIAVVQQVKSSRRGAVIVSRASPELQANSARARAAQQQPYGLPFQIVTIPELLNEAVVGESYRQDAIAKVVKHQGRSVTARIDWDIDNTHDPKAVKVWLVDNGHDVHCGFLPRNDELGYLAEIQRLRGQGNIIHVPAQIFGGEPDKPSYGVWIGQKYAQ